MVLVLDSKSDPVIFFQQPATRPGRGRHVLAPRDPIDPATLPTLGGGKGGRTAEERRKEERDKER